ncbi:MAG: hypothetical protein AAGD38_20975 [Acidobacteriota bacterium]
MDTQTTQEATVAVGQLADAILAENTAAEAAQAGYVNCAVSASLAIGTEGGGSEGWITYTDGSGKVHFQLERVTGYHGIFAGGGAFALIGALPLPALDGNVGRYEATGNSGGGVIRMWVDGRPVLTQPIPVAGAGVPFLNWKLEGEVRFRRG